MSGKRFDYYRTMYVLYWFVYSEHGCRSETFQSPNVTKLTYRTSFRPVHTIWL